MHWIKIIHLLCVMGWMTGVFAVPRALIFWRRELASGGPGGPVGDLTIRLYRFSAGLGLVAIATGLWMGYDFDFPGWVWIKLALVAVLAAHYIYTGILVRAAHRGEVNHSDIFLRIFNEVSVFVAIAILYVVVVQP